MERTNPAPGDGASVRERVRPATHPGLGMSVDEAVIEAGRHTENHFHVSFDEVYYCLEGAGVVFINGSPHPFSPGSCHLLPKGGAHRIAATTKLRLLRICSPGYARDDTLVASQADSPPILSGGRPCFCV